MKRIPNTIHHNGKRYVCRIFDKPDVIDRYTVALKAYRYADQGLFYPYLSSCENPFHPQGFGQHGESEESLTGRHLGKRISIDALPANVRTFIFNELN